MLVRLADPGVFEFAKPSLIVKESAGKALIPVERSNGCDGKVMLKYSTEDMTAVSGKDFEGGENTITFEHGETTKCIEITIYDDQVRNCVPAHCHQPVANSFISKPAFFITVLLSE